MAVTNGEMTSLPTSQPIFLQTAEETEDNRINFRDSLKFFQEQLVINGASFPSPSSVCKSGNDTLRKNGQRLYKEQTTNKTTKDNDTFENEIQSIRGCKIAIPTVDTILESVRVLRAIQKSQKERGTNWNLDVTSKSGTDFNDAWIQTTDLNQNEYSDNNGNNSDIPSINSVDKQTITDISRNVETYSINSMDVKTHTDLNQDGQLQKESNDEINYEEPLINSESNPGEEIKDNESSETQSVNSVNEQIVTYINKKEHSVKESYTEINIEIPSANSVLVQSSAQINQNEKASKESDDKQNDEIISNSFVDKKAYINLNIIECSGKESIIEIINDSLVDTVDNIVTTEEHDNRIQENLTQPKSNLQFDVTNSNSGNEICTFWPSNNLQSSPHWNGEKNFNSLILAEGESTQTDILNDENLSKQFNKIDSFQLTDSSLEVISSDKKNSIDQIQQNEVHINSILKVASENSNVDVTKTTQIFDGSDSLSEVCTDVFNHLNTKIPSTEEKSEELLLKGSASTTEILKIETYEDIDTQKHDHFLLNESLWKENCSPNDSTSTKIEHNDSDSGIGTQRSASSLSPNNPNQNQKDSWSDTCSSHYASAECSPYHSLNSVFESSVGLNNTPGDSREIQTPETLTHLTGGEWEDGLEKSQESNIKVSSEEDYISVPKDTPVDHNEANDHLFDENKTDFPIQVSELESHSENVELESEISYCNFVSNCTIESPTKNIIEHTFKKTKPTIEICDTNKNEPNTITEQPPIAHEQTIDTEEAAKEQTLVIEREESSISLDPIIENSVKDDSCDSDRIQKFTSASCDLLSTVESLYTIKENPAYQVIPTGDVSNKHFEETLFILSEGAFCEYPEENYLVVIKDSILLITKNSEALLSLNMKYGEISVETNKIKIDNRMGRCVYIKCNVADVLPLKAKIELHCLKHWQTDCLQLVHYPLKCHQNVVIIDIGSCSTRAGILMDQPTLPSLFFPTICATDKRTGTCVYGMEALRPEVRQHSNLSFPVRPTNKITKHTIDIDLMEGLFKKIFHDLNVDPSDYTIQVCLPRNLSINAQTALVKLLLEDLNSKAVSLTNQALLTLYAHDVGTAVVVDIGDRTDVLPVVDGFIVEHGVTKLPHGGQRLIHHMKHGLAEKRISLSNDVDSFVVQYIIENLAYVAQDYDAEVRISSQHPNMVAKTVTLQPASAESVHCKSITLEEARFKIAEGLFNPDLWGVDSPGIHHLVQKAIQATSVDARKRIAENIYVSGGVTMLPGFVERLNKEVTKLSKAKIIPKVHASNYRYHCTYIGACKFAKMEVFPQVCITLQEYVENNTSALKKCALYF